MINFNAEESVKNSSASSIKIFENSNFGKIRVAGTSDEPLFCLSDICKVLELQVTPTKNRLKPEGVNLIKGVVKTTNQYGVTTEQEVQMLFVNEQNLYRVIMRSDKPQAEPFQDWVCGEVLPTIRKTGSYSIHEQHLPTTYLEALKALVAAEEQRLALEAENKVMIPKAEYYDTLVERGTSTNIRDTAKELGIKEKKFIQLMIEWGILYRDSKKRLKPTAEAVSKGWCVLKEFNSSSNNYSGNQVLFTVEGKDYLRKRLPAA